MLCNEWYLRGDNSEHSVVLDWTSQVPTWSVVRFGTMDTKVIVFQGVEKGCESKVEEFHISYREMSNKLGGTN